MDQIFEKASNLGSSFYVTFNADSRRITNLTWSQTKYLSWPNFSMISHLRPQITHGQTCLKTHLCPYKVGCLSLTRSHFRRNLFRSKLDRNKIWGRIGKFSEAHHRKLFWNQKFFPLCCPTCRPQILTEPNKKNFNNIIEGHNVSECLLAFFLVPKNLPNFSPYIPLVLPICLFWNQIIKIESLCITSFNLPNLFQQKWQVVVRNLADMMKANGFERKISSPIFNDFILRGNRLKIKTHFPKLSKCKFCWHLQFSPLKGWLWLWPGQARRLRRKWRRF